MNDAVACAGLLQSETVQLRLPSLHALRLRIDEQDLSILHAIERRFPRRIETSHEEQG